MQEAPSVVVERLIKADAPRIFRALTEASELTKWCFTEAATDPRTGGDYRWTWRSRVDPKRDHERFGKYLEVVPHSRIVFEWRGRVWDSNEQMPDTVVTITLTPRGDGTLVRLVHSGWPNTTAARTLRDSHQGGWTYYMENLDAFLNGGADTRAQRHNQLVNA